MSPDTPVSPDSKVAVQVDGRMLTLTNLGKVLYPGPGFTKAEVLDYYQRVAPVLLPHIADRPVTLKRYPGGVDGQAFFQKHVTAHRPDWIRTAEVSSASSRARERGTMVTYLVIDDLPALIWAANLAGLELHTPMWRVPEVRRPDLLVFDLDPGEPAGIVDCCRVARDLRPLLEAEGFAPLAKTSGGKGLQLYAPISGVTSDEASEQARTFAERLARDQPRLVVSRMTKVLRKGKVLIDWSQNNGSKTTVAPYSLRARSSPTVSTPVSWEEVEACRKREDLFFTADAVLDRVARHGDLFAPLLIPPGANAHSAPKALPRRCSHPNLAWRTQASSVTLTVGHSAAITENMAESRSMPSSPGTREGDELRSTPSNRGPRRAIESGSSLTSDPDNTGTSSRRVITPFLIAPGVGTLLAGRLPDRHWARSLGSSG